MVMHSIGDLVNCCEVSIVGAWALYLSFEGELEGSIGP